MNNYTFSDIVPSNAYSKDKISSEAPTEILNYLKHNCRGKANAITAKELNNLLQIGDSSPTSTTIRAIIKSFINDGCLIGSCTQGFYWITTRLELSECVNNLTSRILGIEQRIERLIETWREETGGNI